jgi:hypothetical protein
VAEFHGLPFVSRVQRENPSFVDWFAAVSAFRRLVRRQHPCQTPEEVTDAAHYLLL